MTATQRTKGARGEREFARLLGETLGRALARNLAQARDGGFDILEVDGWAIEVRRRERPRPAAWWRELRARRTARPRLPALAWRCNRRPWQVMVPLDCLKAGAPEEETAILSLAGFAAILKGPGRG